MARIGSTRGTRGVFSGRSSMWTTRSDSHWPYGRRLRELALDLVVGNDALGLEVDEEQLAGQEPALRLDVVRREVEDAGL